MISHEKLKTLEKIRIAAIMLTVVLVVYGWGAFADFAGAKSGVKWRDISQGGWFLWLFLVLGAVVILMQLIPAIIVFFSWFGAAYKEIECKPSEENVPNKSCCAAEKPCKE